MLKRMEAAFLLLGVFCMSGHSAAREPDYPYSILAAGEPLRPQPVTVTFPAGEPLAIRVNCGAYLVDPGWEYVDREGRAWHFDRFWREGAQWGAVGGATCFRDPAQVPAADVPCPEVYRSEHYDLQGYRFRLPEGAYTLRLHFAETYGPSEGRAGHRVFDVTVQGEVVLAGFDPAAESGGFARPVVKEVRGVRPSDGLLEIGFVKKVNVPTIDGIEIVGEGRLAQPFDFELGQAYGGGDGQPLPDPGEAVYRIVCGVLLPDGHCYRAGDVVWTPDRMLADGAGYGALAGGAGVRSEPVIFRGAPAVGVYRSERYAPDGYDFRVPDGTYTVRLHFADGFECHYQAGMRVFDVLVQDRPVSEGFDPFVAGGGLARASILEARGVGVEGGVLRIRFTAGVQNPIISGIEVFKGNPEDAFRAEQLTEPEPRTPLPGPGEGARVQRVLYVGNSHTFFWAIPETVAAMVNTVRDDVWLESHRYLHGGWRLSNFLGEDPNRTPNCLKMIEQDRYDWVVVQVAIHGYAAPEAAQGDRPPTWLTQIERMRTIGDVIRASGARMMVYLLGDPDDGPAGEECRAALMAFAREYDAVIVPVGEAWSALRARETEAPVGLTLRGDGVHVGFHLGYLTACMFYMAWTGESPVGHPHPCVAGQELGLDDGQAAYIQRLAWDFHRDYHKRHGLITAAEHYGR